MICFSSSAETSMSGGQLRHEPFSTVATQAPDDFTELVATADVIMMPAELCRYVQPQALWAALRSLQLPLQHLLVLQSCDPPLEGKHPKQFVPGWEH